MKDKNLMYNVRSKLQLNQKQMAGKLGYSGGQDTISKIETGRRKMSGPARKCLQLIKKHEIKENKSNP